MILVGTTPRQSDRGLVFRGNGVHENCEGSPLGASWEDCENIKCQLSSYGLWRCLVFSSDSFHSSCNLTVDSPKPACGAFFSYSGGLAGDQDLSKCGSDRDTWE